MKLPFIKPPQTKLQKFLTEINRVCDKYGYSLKADLLAVERNKVDKVEKGKDAGK